ncbi:MAG: ATP synthase F0 subunit B [Polyangiales bacterium]
MHSLLSVVASERPLISFDGTLVINIALWLLLFFVLRPLLWEPMVKLLAARESGIQGSRTDATDMIANAASARSEYESALKTARSDAAGEREGIRNAALRKEAEILAQARATVTEAVEAQRDKIRAQREQLSTELKATVPQLAKEIASKALGREVAS